MIQNTADFLPFVNTGMDYEKVIHIVKNKGAYQITCTKILRELFGLSLTEADRIVQQSIHWKSHRDANESLKNRWFSDENTDE
jgi:hypothetical protein